MMTQRKFPPPLIKLGQLHSIGDARYRTPSLFRS